MIVTPHRYSAYKYKEELNKLINPESSVVVYYCFSVIVRGHTAVAFHEGLPGAGDGWYPGKINSNCINLGSFYTLFSTSPESAKPRKTSQSAYFYAV